MKYCWLLPTMSPAQAEVRHPAGVRPLNFHPTADQTGYHQLIQKGAVDTFADWFPSLLPSFDKLMAHVLEDNFRLITGTNVGRQLSSIFWRNFLLNFLTSIYNNASSIDNFVDSHDFWLFFCHFYHLSSSSYIDKDIFACNLYYFNGLGGNFGLFSLFQNYSTIKSNL